MCQSLRFQWSILFTERQCAADHGFGDLRRTDLPHVRSRSLGIDACPVTVAVAARFDAPDRVRQWVFVPVSRDQNLLATLPLGRPAFTAMSPCCSCGGWRLGCVGYVAQTWLTPDRVVNLLAMHGDVVWRRYAEPAMAFPAGDNRHHDVSPITICSFVRRPRISIRVSFQLRCLRCVQIQLSAERGQPDANQVVNVCPLAVIRLPKRKNLSADSRICVAVQRADRSSRLASSVPKRD